MKPKILDIRKVKTLQDVINVIKGMDAKFNMEYLTEEAQRAIKPYLMDDKKNDIEALKIKLLEYTIDYSTMASDNKRRRDLLAKIKEIRKTLSLL